MYIYLHRERRYFCLTCFTSQFFNRDVLILDETVTTPWLELESSNMVHYILTMSGYILPPMHWKTHLNGALTKNRWPGLWDAKTYQVLMPWPRVRRLVTCGVEWWRVSWGCIVYRIYTENYSVLGGGFKDFLIFCLYQGRWSNFTNIFQLGWNMLKPPTRLTCPRKRKHIKKTSTGSLPSTNFQGTC